jgi:hypothetical protein
MKLVLTYFSVIQALPTPRNTQRTKGDWSVGAQVGAGLGVRRWGGPPRSDVRVVREDEVVEIGLLGDELKLFAWTFCLRISLLTFASDGLAWIRFD